MFILTFPSLSQFCFETFTSAYNCCTRIHISKDSLIFGQHLGRDSPPATPQHNPTPLTILNFFGDSPTFATRYKISNPNLTTFLFTLTKHIQTISHVSPPCLLLPLRIRSLAIRARWHSSPVNCNGLTCKAIGSKCFFASM